MITKPKAKHGSSEWLANRWRTEDGKTAFGFSDAAALMRLSPYKTIGELFAEKQSGPVSVEETWAMRKGNILEPVLVKEASERLGIELVTPDVTYADGRWVGSLDAVPARSVDKPELVGEVKVTNRYAIFGSNDLPAEWLAQGHAQAMVVQAPVYFIVFDRLQQLSVVEMPFDYEFAKKIHEAAEFVGELVDSGSDIPWHFVEEMDADAIAKVYRPKVDTVDIGAEGDTLVRLLAEHRRLKKEVEQNEKDTKDRLARLMLDAEVGAVKGVPLVSWKETAGRESFDLKAFKEAHPELAAEFTKRGAPYRTMRLMKVEDGE